MLNSRSYYDEIRFTARRFAADFPAAKVSLTSGFVGAFTDYTSVVIHTADPEVRAAARVAFQSLGEYAHVEEVDGINANIDFTWQVG